MGGPRPVPMIRSPLSPALGDFTDLVQDKEEPASQTQVSGQTRKRDPTGTTVLVGLVAARYGPREAGLPGLEQPLVPAPVSTHPISLCNSCPQPHCPTQVLALPSLERG